MSTPRLLSNRYELGETIGYGGMSEVHRGRDIRLGRDVAVKVLRVDLARDPQFQERFRREAQNAAALNHPAIVAVYDTGETKADDGTSLPYIVMEYVDGRTLRDIVKTQGPLSGKRAMEVMADVCAALDFSHRHGIVHRDVKPANVMITKTGAVKVMDFGIARAVADGQAAMTQTAAVIGTAQYLSPEQARGESVDARSDVYAAGCVLFELLTGEPPFTGDSPVAVAYQHVREDPVPPSTLNPDVSPSLDAIVLKAMAKGPANRYQSAAEMRADLVLVLSGKRPSAPAVMTDEDRTSILAGTPGAGSGIGQDSADAYETEQEEERRRKRRRAFIIGAAVLGLVVIGVLIAWLIGTSGNSNSTSAVPDVKNMSLPQAMSTLQGKGFSVINSTTKKCQPNADKTPGPCTADEIGKVIDQNPQADSVVDKNSSINLTVGGAPDKVQVPDEKGKSPQDATTDLQNRGFTVQATGQESVTDLNLVGKVSSTNPPAGTNADMGSTVTLNIGKAPDTVQVPDVRNQPYDTAVQNLKLAGFNASRQDVSGAQPSGTVINQNPAPFTKEKPGYTVVLQVSKGDQISMPNLVGQTLDQAETTMQQQGWSGSFAVTKVPTNNQSQDGTIQSSTPAAGAATDKNSTISVQVYQYSVIPTSSPSTSRSSG